MTDSATTRLPRTPTSGAQPDSGPPPHAVLWELATMAAVSRCLHAVAQHGVADAVEPHGSEVPEVAERLGLDVDALGRVLRALAAHGVFDVELPTVRHTEASQLLRSDHPMSMRAFAHMMGLPMSWDALTALPTTLETGRAGILDLDANGLFSYLQNHPDQAAVFDCAMTAKSHADIPLVLDAFDFTSHDSVTDIGGGRGHLLRALITRAPGIEATLVDLPEVIARLDATEAEGLKPAPADFFTDTLPATNLYILMEILHDWSDADAVRILSNIRRSAPDNATILIIETVLGAQRLRDPATTLDIVMLAVTGGHERSLPQHASLLAQGGFELGRLIPTGGGVQIIEARSVG